MQPKKTEPLAMICQYLVVVKCVALLRQDLFDFVVGDSFGGFDGGGNDIKNESAVFLAGGQNLLYLAVALF